MTFKHFLCGSLAAFGLFAGLGQASAQEQWVFTKAGPINADGSTPRYAVLRRPETLSPTRRALTLPPTWTYTYTYKNQPFNETFIGTAPSTNTTTTIPVVIIPIKLVSGSTVANPMTTMANGVNVVQNILASPIFQSSVKYVQGGTDVGKTQFEDAFQRATLWGQVKSNTGYHVLFSTPTVEPVQTINLLSANGIVVTSNGEPTILANIILIDQKVKEMLTSLKIPTNAMPLFVITTSYMTAGTPTLQTCCIAGYHSVSPAGEPYAVASYITVPGSFSQNISTVSTELGDWMDDPYTNNPVPSKCGQNAVLEVANPLENATNWGDLNYKVKGVTWNPQAMVLLPYFGAPRSTSVNGWRTFNGTPMGVCSNGE